MRKVTKIVVHCSDSNWGDVNEIRKWHVQGNGWSHIGYHYLIHNGYPSFNSLSTGLLLDWDGLVVNCLDEELSGIHVKGMNFSSIGVCLIGKTKFTDKQMTNLKQLVQSLMFKYHLNVSDVLGHYETPTGAAQGKTCPNIEMNAFRSTLHSDSASA